MLPPSTTAPARSRYWDIVRGIGILSIVMGHCFSKSIIYVYTYHLAIFFFVSGFLYHEKKYSRDPFAHIGAKLKSSWPKYMGYMSLFILLRNLFLAVGINVPAESYNLSQTLAHLGNSLVFYGAEPMGGALWFVPTWILSCGLFGGTMWFVFCFLPTVLPNLFREQPSGSHGPDASDASGSFPWSSLTAFLISLLFGAAGALLIFQEFFLFYQVHLVFLVQPFFAAGWLLRKHLPRFKSFLKWYIAIPCALLLAVLVNLWDLYIDIAIGRIGNGWQYFFLAFLGIYCCMALSALLEKTKKLQKLFALWGKHSFDIMALHFFIFKTIDVCYGRLTHYPPEFYSAFPHSFGNILWPVYILLGTTLPALLGCAWEKGKKKIYSGL